LILSNQSSFNRKKKHKYFEEKEEKRAWIIY